METISMEMAETATAVLKLDGVVREVALLHLTHA